MSLLSNSRPPIPAELKRSVRKRCGFACVICGCPIGYQYDHMDDYAEVQSHEEHNLTLLCPNHHQEKTSGRLHRTEVEKANSEPFATRHGRAAPGSLHTNDVLEVQVGSNLARLTHKSSMTVLAVDNHPLISIQRRDEEATGFDLDLRDRSGQPLLQIQNNEMCHRTDIWDSEWTGTTFVLRSKPRQIVFRMTLELPGRVTIDAGRFNYNDVEILIEPNGLSLPGTGHINNEWLTTDVDVMFALGSSSATSSTVQVLDPPRSSFTDDEVARWINACNT